MLAGAQKARRKIADCLDNVKAMSRILDMGAVAPIGGIALLAGWLCLAWAAWKG